ncbi:MAG: tetratricopeptide repeat protein [Bacteroidota bacterium]
MKTAFYFLLLVCISLHANGSQYESITDSLTAQLQQKLPDTVRINTLTALSKQLRNRSPVQSFSYAQEAYQLSIQANYSKGMGYSSDMLGVLYLSFGDYKKALYHHFQSLNIFEKQKDVRGIAFTYNNLGAVYSHLKNYPKAKSCYQKSIDIKLQNGLFKEASSSYINLGNIAMYQKEIDECIRYYMLGFTNAKKFNDQQNITIGLMNLGEAYFDKGNIPLALGYYRKALARVVQSQQQNFEAQIYFALGKIYNQTKAFETSELYFNKALAISYANNISPLRLNIYKYASQMYENSGRLKEALAMNQQFIALNDSMYNEESRQAINEIQTLYELEKKEEQIKLLNQEKEIIYSRESKEVILRNFFIVGFILISIIAFVSTRSIFRKQKTNRLLQLKNTKIEWQRSEIERTNMALQDFNKELQKENVVARYETLKSKFNPHFLFNNLSTLSALIIQDPKQALQFVSKFSKLYRSIMDHGNDQLVSIEQELDVMANYIYLCKMRYAESLSVTTEIDSRYKTSLIPAFSLQLLVENAVKHNIISKDNPLVVTIYSEDGYLFVKNNYQSKINSEPSSGWGQQSIIERYKLIGDKVPSFGEHNGWYVAKLPLL